MNRTAISFLTCVITAAIAWWIGLPWLFRCLTNGLEEPDLDA